MFISLEYEYSAVIDGVYVDVEETGNFTILFKIMVCIKIKILISSDF